MQDQFASSAAPAEAAANGDTPNRDEQIPIADGQVTNQNNKQHPATHCDTTNASVLNGNTTIDDDNNQAAANETTAVTITTSPAKSLNIADLIDEFGLYQCSLTIVTFIRYVCVAMMTNTGPLIAPTMAYSCLPSRQIEALIDYPNAKDHSQYLMQKCQLKLKDGSDYKCTEWIFDQQEHGTTLTDTFNLVCDRDWLRSAFQSSVSVGVVIASVVFGSFSDEYGRKLTLKICCVISLLAGLVSCWAPNFTVYTISRAICSMSDLGIVGSLYTTIVETFGSKYRGTTCLIVFTGWSMGVMIMPWITDYFRNFRSVMMFTVACHIATLFWLFTVGESIRWLLVNGRIEEANAEVHRICNWNSVSKAEMVKVDEKFCNHKAKYQPVADRNEAIRIEQLSIEEQQGKSYRYSRYMKIVLKAAFGGFFKVRQIFASRELIITTVVIIWTTFNSELLYMLFIMINSDVGDNIKLNYAIGGLMELAATLISIVMIERLTRRLSLSSTLTIISVSMLCLAFTHRDPHMSVWALNFTKFAISTLSSLIYVTVTELFPTSLRQTGMGLAATLGSLGAVIAPFIRTELTDIFGMTNVMLMLSLFPLSAAILIPFYLRETKGVELADDVDDVV